MRSLTRIQKRNLTRGVCARRTIQYPRLKARKHFRGIGPFSFIARRRAVKTYSECALAVSREWSPGTPKTGQRDN